MKVQVKDIEFPEYARLMILRLVTNSGGNMKIEIPLRILDEAGINIEKGESLEVEIKKKLEDMNTWDIVYSCKAYMEREKKTLISCGGLQISIDSDIVDVRPGENIYIFIKKL